MELPANWYLRGLDYSGIVWFRKSFSLEKSPSSQRTFLEFEAVDYRCRVWLNGVGLGGHTGYFAPFSFEITELLRPGRNLAAVEVDAPLDPGFPFNKTIIKGGLQHWDMRPGGWTRRGQERGSGGIWGSVALRATGPARIGRMLAAPIRREGTWLLDLEVEVNFRGSESCESEFKFQLEPANFAGTGFALPPERVRLQPGENRVRRQFEVANPALWWIYELGRPQLYTLGVEVRIGAEVSDQARDRIGFRTVEWRDDGVYLNGRRAYLRGACYLSSLWLSGMSEDRLRRDLELVRAANLNSLRIPYHVEPRRFYRLCDEQGILLWQDFALLWDYDTAPAGQAEMRGQLQDMVRLLHNHPSIFLWCCHCEPLRIGNRRMDRSLARAAAEIERTGRRIKPSSAMSEHPFWGWYLGSRFGFAALPGRPYPTEFGAQSLPALEARLWTELGEKSWPPNPAWEYHNFQPALFHIRPPPESLAALIADSQRYQAELLDFAIQSFRRGKGRTFGYCLFTFVDSWPSISWAIVDDERRPKPAHAAVAKASKPTKLSLDLLRRPLRSALLAPLFWNSCFDQGREFFCRVWAINDRTEPLPGGRLAWRAVSEEGQELFRGEEPVAVEPDSARPVRELIYPLPRTVKPGPYRLEVSWRQGEQELDREELGFRISPPGGRRRHAAGQMLEQVRADFFHAAFAFSTFPRYLVNALRGQYH